MATAETYKKDYKIESKKLNIPRDMAVKILNIFSSPSSKVLTSKDLESEFRDINLKQVLILSEKMEKALKFVKDRIFDINQPSSISNQACMFYTTDFGGSKTQFIHLVLEEVLDEWKNDSEINVIPISFQNLGQVDVYELKKQVLAIILKTLSELLDTDKELHIYNKIIDLTTKAGISSKSHSILISIKELVSDINHKNVQTILELLNILPIYDDEQLFEFIAELMTIASQKGITFLFCFDEMDAWLSDDSTDFKLDFYKRATFLQKLFDLGSKIKLFYLFAVTERVINLLKSVQKTDPREAAITRLASYLNDSLSGSMKKDAFSILIREDGKYIGQDAKTAILRFLRLFDIAGKFKIADIIFKSIIQPIINQIDGILLRRYANTQIISILEVYTQIITFLTEGFKKLNLPSSYAMGIGTEMQEVLTVLLQRLGYSYQLKHYPTPSGRKIDGILLQNGEVFYGEIKYISSKDKLSFEKLKQAYEKAEDTGKRTYFFCCGEDISEEDVLNVIKRETTLKPLDIKKDICNLIQPVCINEKLLLAAMIGAKDKVFEEETMEIIAKWSELISDLPSKLYRVFPYTTKLVPEEKEEEPLEKEPLEEVPPPVQISATVDSETEIRSMPHLTAIKIIEKMRKTNGKFQWTMVISKMKKEHIPTGDPLNRYIEQALQVLHSLNIIKSNWKSKIVLNLKTTEKTQCKSNPEVFYSKWTKQIKANIPQKSL
ncbi:MAG: hypothetical protein HWN67_20110 [Candidatus Helarchaeota archaeon]|nr:hypothetical protein [Candidatus Helarchaeota archaeon]